MENRLCRLALDLGAARPCTGTACAFWEDAGCLIERLGVHALHDAQVSGLLLEIRAQLEAARTTSRGEFARRLGRDD
jgi:hypothetical protein